MIGQEIAETLFPFVDPLEKEIQIDGLRFRVVGVAEKKGKFLGLNRDQDILVPLESTGKRDTFFFSFLVADVYSLADEGPFDLIFTRYLLSHLPDPARAAATLARTLAPGGVLVVEDVDFPGHVCYPPHPAFDRYVSLYEEVVLHHGGDPSRYRWFTIVGVVPNIKHSSLDEDASLQVYEPFDQNTVWSMHFTLRTAGRPEAILPTLRSTIAAIDPALPLFNVTTLEQALDRTLMPRRLTSGLLAGFAGAAVLLAAIGIYGVMSLNVGGRIGEFGIRMALGASPGQVKRLVVRHGLALVLPGVVMGLFGAAALTRFLGSLLFGVKPIDPLTFIAVALVVALVALLALVLPARRAMRLDAVAALRTE